MLAVGTADVDAGSRGNPFGAELAKADGTVIGGAVIFGLQVQDSHYLSDHVSLSDLLHVQQHISPSKKKQWRWQRYML